jgi:Fuseless
MYLQPRWCHHHRTISINRIFTADWYPSYHRGLYHHPYPRSILHHPPPSSSRRRRPATTIRKRFVKSPTTRKPPKLDPSPFAAYTDPNMVLYHVLVGMCSASFWRGAWYILDDVLFPQEKELSAISSLMLGTVGMLSVQGSLERIETYTLQLKAKHEWLSTQSIRHVHSVLRFATIYSLVLSVVCVWRGTWMSWDLVYAKYYNDYAGIETGIVSSSSSDSNGDNEEIHNGRIQASDPGHALRSGLMSHCTAVIILSGLGIVASVFAPPAAISIIRDTTIFSTKTSIERILYAATAARNASRRTIASNKFVKRSHQHS